MSSVQKVVAYKDVDGVSHDTKEEAVIANVDAFLRDHAPEDSYLRYGSIQVARFLVEQRHRINSILEDLK